MNFSHVIRGGLILAGTALALVTRSSLAVTGENCSVKNSIFSQFLVTEKTQNPINRQVQFINLPQPIGPIARANDAPVPPPPPPGGSGNKPPPGGSGHKPPPPPGGAGHCPPGGKGPCPPPPQQPPAGG